jgi:hypothetical protein
VNIMGKRQIPQLDLAGEYSEVKHEIDESSWS